MARAAAAFGVVALLVSIAWLRLEQSPRALDVLPVLALAALPALALVGSRSLERRRRVALVALVVLGSTVLASAIAFGLSPLDARPRSDRDFFGPALGAARDGFLDFYDTSLPFNRVDFPLMHGLVLLAVFGFTAVGGLVVAARRSTAAALLLLVALGWPATLISGERPLVFGAVALAGLLALLFLLREGAGARVATGLPQAAVVGAALVVLALGASTSDAVAKQAFLHWQGWDLYDRPQDPVGVEYVWDSRYDGIRFPKEETVVLRVKVEGPRRPLYWRATTLDEYTGTAWHESFDEPERIEDAETIDVRERDPFLPRAARDEETWVRQEVKVEALRGKHLVASSQPVRWRPGTSAPVQVAHSGIVTIPESLRQGQRYTAWSYVPRAKPAELTKASTNYPEGIDRYLEVVSGYTVPAFGEPGRTEAVEHLFDVTEQNFVIAAHRPLWDVTKQVAGDATTPYGAALALETWFRQEGGFVYDETPPPYSDSIEPPLVAFVLEDKRGYCQHYAGAMALMLRMLGVPAREAAGFTSGTYDTGSKEWTVTDHNAHTWVEVYFPGFGWLPFDPTPNRGVLEAQYSVYGTGADGRQLLEVIRDTSGFTPARLEQLRSQNPNLEASGVGSRGGAAGGSASGAAQERGGSLVKLVLLVLGGGVAAILLLKAVLRRVRFATRDPRRLAAACRRDLVGFMADQGVETPPSATLSEVGQIAERQFVVTMEPFVRSVGAARFAPPSLAREAVGRAQRELRLLRRQMGGQLGLGSRLRGALSLRSLTL